MGKILHLYDRLIHEGGDEGEKGLISLNLSCEIGDFDSIRVAITVLRLDILQDILIRLLPILRNFLAENKHIQFPLLTINAIF